MHAVFIYTTILIVYTKYIFIGLTLNSKKKAVNHGNTKDTNNIKRTAMASKMSALLMLSQVYRIKVVSITYRSSSSQR